MNAALLAFAVTLLAGVLIVLTKDWHGWFSMDSPVGIQKFHTHPTPRIGGVAIFLGVWLAAPSAPPSIQQLLLPIVYAGLPAFVFGLVEDITKRVSVLARLLATTLSGVLGWAITGLSITEVQVFGLDWLLAFTFLSVVFTGFSVGGIANAINIIDGFNGLAAGTAMIILAGMGAMAWSFGDAQLVAVCLVLAASTAGFFLLNWPFGKLFLGDGGAYFVGFSIAWVAVLLLSRHHTLSAWSPMLACAFPILEVFFSVVRRRRRKLNPLGPDSLHLHSLIKRRLVRRLLSSKHNTVRNSVTGAVMCLATVVPVWLAVHYARDPPSLMLGFVLLAFCYRAVYYRLTQFKWCFSPATMELKPALRVD